MYHGAMAPTLAPTDPLMLSRKLVEALNKKFPEDHFEVDPLVKYVRVTAASGPGRRVYLFVNEAGEVLKPAGWSKPAKGVRAHLTPETLEAVVERADRWGGWLYKR